MKLHQIKSDQKRRSRKRVGRGTGSGTGTYSGRGLKGQKARTGGSIRPGFEGGRMPLIRQMPKKRGFRSIHSDDQIINLSDLNEKFETGDRIDVKILKQKGMIESANKPVKILGNGDMKKKVSVVGLKCSTAAAEAIKKAGGTVEPQKVNEIEK